MAGNETQMMRRIYHVSGEPEGGVLTYATDAHIAVGRFPEEWSFTPWDAEDEPAEGDKPSRRRRAAPSKTGESE
jgi:hypothetical protein